MKRLLTVLVVAAIAMAAYPAFAAVNGTPHDYIGANVYGRCGVCHVPHAASAVTAKRLWRGDFAITKTGTWETSTVGVLCGSCHNGGGMAAANADTETPHAVGALAYSAGNSHGRDWATLTGAADNTHLGDSVAGGQTKPYTASGNIEAGKMECTSCHNPHDDGTGKGGTAAGIRPFLRAGVASATTISGVCADCHNNRANLTGAIGVANGTVGLENGNHPVNVDYNSAVDYFKVGASVPVALTTHATLTAWSLGGKFQLSVAGATTNIPVADYNGAVTKSATYEVGCMTCHAVHGSNAGGGYTAGTDQSLHLLAINNVAANSALCEGCHGNPTGNAARPSSGATMMVGMTAGDHPIDIAVNAADGGPTIDHWYLAAGDTAIRNRTNAANTYWPRGTGGNVIVCSSCHSAHKALGTLELNRAGSGAATWCQSCHSSASPNGHHSHTANSGSTVVTCGMCHSGAAGAHNGFDFAFTNTCTNCHTAGVDPVEAILGLNAAGPPAGHLGIGVVGAQSHYIGAFANAGANYIHVKTNRWTADAVLGAKTITYLGGITADTSYYGSATGNALGGGVGTDPLNTVYCESCHSVTGNVGAGAAATPQSGWQNNLLFQSYQDDSDGTAGARAVGSQFCLGCHNQAAPAAGPVAADVPTNAPLNMHPLTSQDITRAIDAGYVSGGTATLKTTDAVRTTYAHTANALTAGAAGGRLGAGPLAASYPALNNMDCDSCHRPHQAPANSTFNQTKTKGAGVAVPVILEVQAAVNEYSDLCQQCHEM